MCLVDKLDGTIVLMKKKVKFTSFDKYSPIFLCFEKLIFFKHPVASSPSRSIFTPAIIVELA